MDKKQRLITEINATIKELDSLKRAIYGNNYAFAINNYLLDDLQNDIDEINNIIDLAFARIEILEG